MSQSTAGSLVITERSDTDVVTLTMNKPRFNTLDLEMMHLLHSELAIAVKSNARAIVLTGAHSCFCAGLDTRALQTYDVGDQRRTVEILNILVRDLYGAPVPTIAAVPGHALAGGLVFALACDRRYVTTGACKLGLPEVQAGVPYPAVPMIVVDAELDASTRRLLVLGGNPITPQEAVNRGVFDAAVDPAELLAFARTQADELAGPAAFGRIKAQLRADALACANHIIETAADPMLGDWI